MSKNWLPAKVRVSGDGTVFIVKITGGMNPVVRVTPNNEDVNNFIERNIEFCEGSSEFLGKTDVYARYLTHCTSAVGSSIFWKKFKKFVGPEMYLKLNKQKYISKFRKIEAIIGAKWKCAQ